MLNGEEKETFQADTEIMWVEFHDCVAGILGNPQEVHLSRKIASVTARYALQHLNGLSRFSISFFILSD